MFQQLEKLIPKGGVINMTLANGATEGKYRLTLAPYLNGTQPWKPMIFDDVTLAELDDAGISFEPVNQATISITEAIAASAAATKAAAPAPAKVETTPSGVKKTTSPKGAKGTTTKYEAPTGDASAAPAGSMANVPAAPGVTEQEDTGGEPLELKPEETPEEKAEREAEEKRVKDEEDARIKKEAEEKERAEKEAKVTNSLEDLQKAIGGFSDDDILAGITGTKPAA